jgi:hypothetical protein
MQEQQRGAQERRRDEGLGERAKEVARAAGGEAAGAWVIVEGAALVALLVRDVEQITRKYRFLK